MWMRGKFSFERQYCVMKLRCKCEYHIKIKVQDVFSMLAFSINITNTSFDIDRSSQQVSRYDKNGCMSAYLNHLKQDFQKTFTWLKVITCDEFHRPKIIEIEAVVEPQRHFVELWTSNLLKLLFKGYFSTRKELRDQTLLWMKVEDQRFPKL